MTNRLRRHAAEGIEAAPVKKLQEGRPNLLDLMAEGRVALVMNTPSGKGARTDEGRIRAAATAAGVPCLTTIEAAEAAGLSDPYVHIVELGDFSVSYRVCGLLTTLESAPSVSGSDVATWREPSCGPRADR